MDFLFQAKAQSKIRFRQNRNSDVCLAENIQNPDCCFDPISDAPEDICAVIDIFNKLLAEAEKLAN